MPLLPILSQYLPGMAFHNKLSQTMALNIQLRYFVKFAKDYGFTHITSRPKYPQANGEAKNDNIPVEEGR